MAVRKGDVAKQNVIDTITKAFGENFVGIVDKKLYVWADDGGEKVQISIALTMPKTQVESSGTPVNSNEGAWSDDATNQASPRGQRAAVAASMELSDEDRQKVQELMKNLGISD